MVASPSLAAFTAESARLSEVLSGLAAEQWTRPTRCEPWDVAALQAHITTATGRLAVMLEAEPPPSATVSAAGYYRPDIRFSPETNAARIATATEQGSADGTDLAADFDRTWRQIAALCEDAPVGRRVTTRHGDPMTLEDFLTTRVVEVAVHGIDLADAVGHPRWTTAEALTLIIGLLLGEDGQHELTRLGWESSAFIAKATGRDVMSAAERAHVEELSITWLTLG